jgi:hypothetical protein
MTAVQFQPTRAVWTRRVMVGAVALLALGVLLWAVAPAGVCWWLRGYLPKALDLQHGQGSIIIATVATALPPLYDAKRLPGTLKLMASPGCLRGMIMGAGIWIPPGLLRSGQFAAGNVILPDIDPQGKDWRIVVDDRDEIPTVSLQIASRELNEYLAANAVTPFVVTGRTVGICRYQVDSGTITDDGSRVPMACGQLISVKGRVIVDMQGTVATLAVAALTARAHWRWVLVHGGMNPICTIHFEHVQAEAKGLGILGMFKSLLFSELERIINQAIAKGLKGAVVPIGFPPTIAVDATILPAIPASGPL